MRPMWLLRGSLHRRALPQPALACNPPAAVLPCRGREALLALGERLNEEGLRVLAVAVKELPDVEAAFAAAADPGTPPAPTTPHASKEGGGSAGGRGTAGPSGSGSAGGSPLALAAASRRSSLTSIAAQRAVTVEHEAQLAFVGFLAFLVGAWERLSSRTKGAACLCACRTHEACASEGAWNASPPTGCVPSPLLGPSAAPTPAAGPSKGDGPPGGAGAAGEIG